jgi:hypothetical protein
MRRVQAIVLPLIAVFASPLTAAPATCPAGQVVVNAAVRKAIEGAAAALDDNTIPSDRQVAAPSSASGSPTLVDHASFPAVLGAALNDRLVTTGDRSATVDLNFFAFETLAHPDYLSSQSKYQEHTIARKFGGSITFGGTGDKFDRNGDGRVDDPLMAKNLGDIIDYELRFRLSRSTDRREPYNAGLLVNAIDPGDTEILNRFNAFLKGHREEIEAMSDTTGCAPEGLVKALLDRSSQDFSSIGAAIVEANHKLQTAVDTIDRRPVWSIVAGGSERRQQFGANSVKLGIRAELFKSKGHENTFNLDWLRRQSLLGMPEMKTLKGSFQHTYTWKKGSTIAPEGIDISASASFEHTQNVPDVKHPDIFKVNAKLEYPLTKAIKIPISISWANHTDLLTDEHNVRGHVGFTVDFSKLTKPDNDTLPSSP